MRKYELTDETCRQNGRALHRICALRDIPRHGVRKGDLGGWVESERMLSQDGNAWIGGDARVYGDAWIDGDAWVYGNAWIDAAACLLTATIYTSQRLHATAFRQKDGSWHVRVGCWSGSVPELRALAESDRWVETPHEDIEEARPELLAFVALCEARAARTAL